MSRDNIEKSLRKYSLFADSHSIWRSRLLEKMSAGEYSREQLAFIFQQHYLYSKNFTRLLCLVAAHFDKSAHRATIVENLYEEAGEQNITNRHSLLMRKFLQRIGVQSVDDDQFMPFTKLYVERCISYIKNSGPIEAAAFMAWGTEGIVPRLYRVFVAALEKTGLTEEDYHYFTLHIECDDGHHEMLVELVADMMKTERGSFSGDAIMERIFGAIRKALDLREEYFNYLYHQLDIKPLLDVYHLIQDRNSRSHQSSLLNTKQSIMDGHTLYQNDSSSDGVNFHVARIPFGMDSLDPRILTIYPDMRNESHKHAHETFFYVLSGKGNCCVDGEVISIEKGSMVHVPRWSLHHTTNVGEDNLVILAVTDYGLTRRLSGNTEESYRKILPEDTVSSINYADPGMLAGSRGLDS